MMNIYLLTVALRDKSNFPGHVTEREFEFFAKDDEEARSLSAGFCRVVGDQAPIVGPLEWLGMVTDQHNIHKMPEGRIIPLEVVTK